MQLGIDIDYATGDSALVEEETPEASAEDAAEASYVPNTSTKKFHLPTCGSVSKMKESNKQTLTGARQDLVDRGYSPCGKCNP